jgi:hypothetical protein
MTAMHNIMTLPVARRAIRFGRLAAEGGALGVAAER